MDLKIELRKISEEDPSLQVLVEDAVLFHHLNHFRAKAIFEIAKEIIATTEKCLKAEMFAEWVHKTEARKIFTADLKKFLENLGLFVQGVKVKDGKIIYQEVKDWRLR